MEDRLKEYRKKRDLTKSGEPAGESTAGSGERPVYVIQKHAARTLHYDLRLEIAGVLASWAVPKGPSPDPAEKRLAIPTEDHPLAYAAFEGVIPAGEYGAGTVMVWDAGTYDNLRAEKEGDGATMEEALAEGKLEVRLKGHRLKGGYALIRTGRLAAKRWLLIKMHDAEADPLRDPARSEARSVLSGRTMEEIRGGNGG
jgi:DNA ligase D-like protein (predicted 3'-phosphoesterase)